MNNGNILNNKLSLSDLFHPEVFLNALRQSSARNMKTSIDSMKLVSTFHKNDINCRDIL